MKFTNDQVRGNAARLCGTRTFQSAATGGSVVPRNRSNVEHCADMSVQCH
jgi:hypothetical protein